MNLKAFIEAPRHHAWGGVDGDDCMTLLATWVAEITGVDPAASLRGTYRDREGADAIIAEAGGMVPLVERLVLPSLCRRVQLPADGDIAVVAGPDGHEAGAIRFGPLWAMMSLRGVMAKRWDAKAIWRPIHA
ncbi:DUF6950 family protein [Martelella endophytica]|uniref:DUF6950 domain-containing protein n=1 Tax=Martelella endophytica TaxID=1486262 RepID=A0A0D5LL17_MAREN|nr:hypothetical protein [Martelella endophytica]AJY44660.1 hypothetical protein TM49_01525 [Martelella endophytica]